VVGQANATYKPEKSMLATMPLGIYRRGDKTVSVAQYGTIFEVSAEIGTIQPGTTKWSPGSFYIGAQRPITVAAHLEISANNLRTPISLTAEIDIATRSQVVTLKDITGRDPEQE